MAKEKLSPKYWNVPFVDEIRPLSFSSITFTVEM